MRPENVMVPTRFLVTLGHLIAVFIAAQTVDDNVAASIPSDSSLAEFTAAKEGVMLITYFSLAFFAIDLFGLLRGYTMFQNNVNVAHVCFHFLGSVYMCWYIMYSWHIRIFTYLFIFSNVFPTTIEIIAILRIACC
eukprot:g4834.t1